MSGIRPTAHASLCLGTSMDWKQAIEQWQALPPEERSRRAGARIPLNVAESMAFAGEPVDLKMLEEEHARRAARKEAPASDRRRPLN